MLINLKKISNEFISLDIVLPSFIAKFFLGKYFSFIKVFLIFSSNATQIKRGLIKKCSIICLFPGEVRDRISDIIDIHTSFFWSYKDTLIIINHLKKKVYRISGPKSFKFTLNNFKTQQYLYKNDLYLSPNPISIEYISNFIITSEKYLEKDAFSKSKIDFENIFKNLSPLYKLSYSKISSADFTRNLVEKFIKLVPKNRLKIFKDLCDEIILNLYKQSKYIEVICTGIIHGDLSFDNLLISNNELKFIDLDRSEISLPEFDVFTLFIDNQIKLYKHRTYKNQINLASNLKNNVNAKKCLDLFYNNNFDYCENKNLYNFICDCFYIRIVAYALSDANFDKKILIDILK